MKLGILVDTFNQPRRNVLIGVRFSDFSYLERYETYKIQENIKLPQEIPEGEGTRVGHYTSLEILDRTEKIKGRTWYRTR